ncbi:MAG: hypothetical protein JNM25_08045 [Planctomycetes bacterium]|nr:hypothetical protein [Planctomycetota bacterium]
MDKKQTRAQKLADRIARKAEKRDNKDDSQSGPRLFEVTEHPDRPEHPDNRDRPADSG